MPRTVSKARWNSHTAAQATDQDELIKLIIVGTCWLVQWAVVCGGIWIGGKFVIKTLWPGTKTAATPTPVQDKNIDAATKVTGKKANANSSPSIEGKKADAAEPGQLNFQTPATEIMEKIVDLHHDLMFFIIVIVVFVSWMLGRILYFQNTSKKPALPNIFAGARVFYACGYVEKLDCTAAGRSDCVSLDQDSAVTPNDIWCLGGKPSSWCGS